MTFCVEQQGRARLSSGASLLTYAEFVGHDPSLCSGLHVSKFSSSDFIATFPHGVGLLHPAPFAALRLFEAVDAGSYPEFLTWYHGLGAANIESVLSRECDTFPSLRCKCSSSFRCWTSFRRPHMASCVRCGSCRLHLSCGP
jgi:hypothetical protein